MSAGGLKLVGSVLIVIGFIFLPLSCFSGGASLGIFSLIALIVGFGLFLGGRQKEQSHK